MTAFATRALILLTALVGAGGSALSGSDTASPNVAADAAAGSPLTEDECRQIWNTAAGRSDLGRDGAKPYIDAFESVDANHDSKISNAEFKAGCMAGHVHKFRGSK
jgi:hypothetical protein